MFKDLNTFGYSILLIIFIFYSINGLYFILKEERNMYIERSEFFWANVAILTYASGTFFIFLFKDYLHDRNANAFNLIWLTAFVSLNSIKNFLLAFSLSAKTK